MHRSLRKRLGRASSHSDVVPRQYVVLNVESNAHTREECVRADRQNKQLYAKKIKAVDGLGTNVRKINIDPIPLPTNADRFDIWMTRNKKVPADKQCIAVETLYAKGMLVDRDYKPEDAIEIAKTYPPPFKKVSVNDTQYKIVDDDKIMSMSMEQCKRIDSANQKAYEKEQSETTKIRRRLSSVCLADIEDVVKPPDESNVEKKVRLTAQTMEVSACMQAYAVQTLLSRNQVPFVDFQPQNAIATANRSQATAPNYNDFSA